MCELKPLLLFVIWGNSISKRNRSFWQSISRPKSNKGIHIYLILFPWCWDSVKDFGEIRWFKISYAVNESCNCGFSVPGMCHLKLMLGWCIDVFEISLQADKFEERNMKNRKYTKTGLWIINEMTLARLQNLSLPNLWP